MTTLFRNTTLALVALAVVACGKDEPAEDVASAVESDAAEALLKFVPADTPYFAGKLAPYSDELYAAMEPMTEQTLNAYRGMLKGMVEAASEEGGDDDALAEHQPLLEEIYATLSVQGLKDLGIDMNGVGILYGQGLLPVLRQSVTDTDKLEAGIKRFEERAGESMRTGNVAGIDYRYTGDDKARIVLATVENQFVVAVVPSAASEEMMAQVLGATLPERHLGQTDKLDRLAADNAYLPQTLGFIDTVEIAETLVADPTGVDKEFLALVGYDSTELSDACRTEFRELAGIMPAIEFGYRNMTPTLFDGHGILKLRSDIATGLAEVTAPVPGLGGEMDGVFTYGMGMDLRKLAAFAEARVAAIQADPYECEQLVGLNEQAASMEQSLNAPIPPMVYNVKGLLLKLDDLSGLMQGAAFAPQSPPDFRALLAVDGAGALYMLGAGFLPGLAELNLEPNGETVELPPGTLPNIGETAYVAMNESAIALGMGEKAAAGLSDMLSAPPSGDEPLMAMSYDLEAYSAFMQSIMESAAADDPDADPQELGELFGVVGDFYDRVWMDVLVTERGIEIPSTVTLQQ